jgi:hypothetical protein
VNWFLKILSGLDRLIRTLKTKRILIHDLVMNHRTRRVDAAIAGCTGHCELSDREIEILKLLVFQYTNPEISQRPTYPATQSNFISKAFCENYR